MSDSETHNEIQISSEENAFEGELIYNEDAGEQQLDRLFNDESEVYGIEFKIMDKNKIVSLLHSNHTHIG